MSAFDFTQADDLALAKQLAALGQLKLLVLCAFLLIRTDPQRVAIVTYLAGLN